MSLLFVVAVSGFVTFKTVSGSEAGLTTGTPMLTAAELRAMAPEPLPVVADPSSAVEVSPKGIAQAEQMTEAAAAERVAKAAAKKAKADAKKKDAKNKVAAKDAKKTDAKKTDAKKSDKSDAKKTDVAKKTDKKSDKKADAKKTDVAKKTDKKSDKKTDAKKSDPKLAEAKKPAKKDAKESKDKKTDAKAKVAAKPVKAKAKPVEVAQVEESEEDTSDASASDEGSSDDSDEAEEAPKAKPAKKEAKSEKAPKSEKADKSKKSVALAKNGKSAKAKAAPAASEADSDTDSEGEEVAAAPAKPAADPTVIAAEDQERFKAAVTTWLQSLATIETGGSADVKLSGMRYGKAQGKDAVLFERAALVVSQVKLQTTHVKKATLELRELALDAAQLKSGACALVNTPTVVPDLTLEHAQVQAQLGKNNIKSPNIAYEGQQMVFTGKAPFMFFSIPFKMAGKFERNGNNIAFRIAELEIKGSAAGADRRASVQAKLENMIKLENVLAPIGAPGAPVRGGKVNIEDGTNIVYSTAIDGAVPAE